MFRNLVLFISLITFTLAGCSQSVQNVPVPPPQDQTAYQPVVQPKPLPVNAYNNPMGVNQGSPSVGVNPYGEHVPLPDEPAYVQAYQAQHSPRIMIEVIQPQTTSPYTPAIAASQQDYDAIQISMIDYLGANGQVDIQDPTMAQKVLDRESFLRLQNGDQTVLPLLKQSLQTDVVVVVQAAPTAQATIGTALRLLVSIISTTDGRVLGADYVDMPLPMSKTNINLYTSYLADKVMQKLAAVWNGGVAAYNPIIVRIYNAASVDDVLTIKQYIQKVPGVLGVINRGITGSSTSAYGELAVQYGGAPDDFYSALKQELGGSTGLKATDLQNNTVDIQITGPMNLQTK
ncbi:MAG TPA: hypothetical protein VMG59_11995 [Phycisphaerae bacterium]|nr:hypothetical protein [Phycisphaerae bacterium]